MQTATGELGQQAEIRVLVPIKLSQLSSTLQITHAEAMNIAEQRQAVLP